MADKPPVALEARGEEGDGRRYSPSAARNREPIRDVLALLISVPTQILEIASGTGEHGAFLTASLEGIDWTHSLKEMQRNWIGRSAGAMVDFPAGQRRVRVFTTRPDTLFGATFLVLAPDCDAEGAPHIAARLCQAISAYPVPTSSGLVPMTLSVGVAVARTPITASDLLHNADGALYRAKASGRNRFEIASRMEETRSR